LERGAGQELRTSVETGDMNQIDIKTGFFLGMVVSIVLLTGVSMQAQDLSQMDQFGTGDQQEVPDEAVLRQMGLNESQIRQIMARSQQPQMPSPQKAVKDTTEPQTEIIEVPVITEMPEEVELPPATVYGQAFFRNKKANYFERAADARAAENYVLGVGDEVTVAVWGFSNYNQAFQIDDNGAIDPKGVGRIYLKGLTFAKARAMIKRRYGSYLNLANSQIDISLNYSRVITVNIVGEVFNPGSYRIPAVNTAFNALIEAQGPNQIGSVRSARIMRNGKVVKRLDLYRFLMDPQSREDFFLQDNDYLLVPAAGRVVEVNGQIRRPDRYELIEGEGLIKLLDYAGGLRARAYRKNIQVRRFKDNQEIVIDIDLDSLISAKQTFLVNDGDQVLVREIPEGLRGYVSIGGAVHLPGTYELRKGDRISDLIERAEGLTFEAHVEKSYLVRTNLDMTKSFQSLDLKQILEQKDAATNLVLQEYDEIQVFSNEDFLDEYEIKVFGAVRKPGNFIYTEGMTLQDVLYLTGGLKLEAASSRIEVSRIEDIEGAAEKGTPTRTIVESLTIGKDLKLDQASAAFKLAPYDQVFVRAIPDFEYQQNVKLEGEIVYPGYYSLLSKEEKLVTVIERAGGLTNWAFLEGATLHRADGNLGFVFMDLDKAMKNKGSAFNYVLKSGDVISIPKVNELVAITGAVNYPNIDSIGSVNAIYNAGRRARYYVKHFGVGFAKDAKRRHTFVTDANGLVRKPVHFGILSIYPRVNKGSVISIPVKEEKIKRQEREKKPIDWNAQQ
jgi:protein involved in polysaccharide export with SLBB domain